MGSLPKRTDELSGKTLKQVAAVLAVDAAEEAKSNPVTIRNTLPPGVKMDAHGNLTGTHTISKAPTNALARPPTLRAATWPRFSKRPEKPSLAKTVDCGGEKVVGQATSDFYRLNYTVPLPNGKTFKSTEDPAKDQQTRNVNINQPAVMSSPAAIRRRPYFHRSSTRLC